METTFKPKLNKKSEKLVESRPEWISNVVDRLMHTQKIKFEESLRQIEEKNRQLSQQCTFKPTTNCTSELMNNSQNMSASRLNSSFYQRQVEFLNQKKEKLEELAREINPIPIPKINPISKVLAFGKEEEFLSSTFVAKHYKIPMQRKEETIKAIAQQEQRKYPFKPEINEISKYIAKRKTVNELSQFDQSKKAKIIELKKENETREFSECSFRPKINSNYKNVEPKFIPENIDATLANMKRVKHFKEKLMVKEKEFEELKECTFQPKIIGNSLPPSLLSKKKLSQSVKGIDKFMGKVERATKLKQEQLEREKKAFNHPSMYDSKAPLKYTIPKPFSLSGVQQDRETIVKEARKFKQSKGELFWLNTETGADFQSALLRSTQA